MKAFFAALGTALYERVWLSYRSTILGIAVAAIGEALNYTLNAYPDPRIHALCALLTTVFIAWKEKKVKEGSIKLLVIAFFFVSFGTMAAAGTPSGRTAQAAVSGGTLADVAPSDPPPLPVPGPFGGCMKSGKACFGPSVAVSMLSINLSSGSVEGSFKPGLGYGFTVNPGQWTAFGADAYFVVDPGAQQVSASIVAKLINGYFRVGVSKGFIGDKAWRIPIGFGIDL